MDKKISKGSSCFVSVVALVIIISIVVVVVNIKVVNKTCLCK